jgi:hypothetical protein
MHISGPIEPETARRAGPATPHGHNMLWVRIKMQRSGAKGHSRLGLLLGSYAA